MKYFSAFFRPLVLLAAMGLNGCSGDALLLKEGGPSTALELAELRIDPPEPVPFTRPLLLARARNADSLRVLHAFGGAEPDTSWMQAVGEADEFNWVDFQLLLPELSPVEDFVYWFEAIGEEGTLRFPPDAPTDALRLLASPPDFPDEYLPGMPRMPRAIDCQPDWDRVEQSLPCAGQATPAFPALNQQVWVDGDEATVLINDRMGIGIITPNGKAWFLPRSVMLWHEGSNFDQSGRRWMISYCPLTMSANFFDTGIAAGSQGRANFFQITGGLYNSNLVIGRQDLTGGSNSWPQILSHAIAGPERGKCLALRPAVLTDWDLWKALHPNSKVLEGDPNFPEYDYLRRENPYADYWAPTSPELRSSLCHEDSRLGLKEMVLGVYSPEALAFKLPARTVTWNGEIDGMPATLFVAARGRTAWLFAREEGLEFRSAGFEWRGIPLYVDNGVEPSWWSPEGVCIAGPRVGEKLEWWPSVASFWLGWSSTFPGGRLVDPLSGEDL